MSQTTPGTRLPRALRPFASGQYRLLAGALVFSMLSVGIWLVASVWQVIALGGSPTDLSLVAAGASLGLVLSVLIGGAAADRIPQRFIMLTVELVRGIGFAVAAILSLTGVIQIWQLAAIAFALGIADGFFYPAYSAWLPALIDEDELLAANGIEGVLRPTIMQAAGPALASVIIAVWSPGIAFLVVAIVQLGAAAALIAMRTTAVRRDLTSDRHPLVSAAIDIRDGFTLHAAHQVAAGHPAVRDRPGAGRHGPDRGPAAIRGEGSDRRRCRCFRLRAWAPSGSAGRSARWLSPRPRCPGGT